MKAYTVEIARLRHPERDVAFFNLKSLIPKPSAGKHVRHLVEILTQMGRVRMKRLRTFSLPLTFETLMRKTMRTITPVRVKKIKAKGKNLPLSLVFNADEDEDEKEDKDEGMIEALQGYQKISEDGASERSGGDTDD
ncbi:hypothetical protein EDD18DRAFT_1099051 [Armillaria luteobubalina]|uniref:Uncharacterized protein n=1 Tax=Armillaria luteobubalina TaxID=153913 RepID=A0AA39QIT1_9AGAR|nr:hypothetical protein EDD18DRAFT_1099051 [Armillaria luteobubalina]